MKWFPVKKVEAALFVAVLAGLGAALDALGAFDWSGLGAAGPLLGAGVAAFVAYMRTDGIGWLKRHFGDPPA